jgi:hypothetical protein
MVKTTIYLPEELDIRLEAESAASGVSKAELIRRGIFLLLTRSDRSEPEAPLPVFHSGHALTAADMDREIHEHIKDRAARR